MSVTYSNLDPFAKNVISVGSTVHIVPQSATLKPGTAEESASLKSVTAGEWKLLANISNMKISSETENDEIQYFDAETQSWTKDPQTSVTLTKIEISAYNLPPLLDAMLKRVPDPLSEEAQAQLSAGSQDGAPFAQANDPYVHVGLKIVLYNKKKEKIQEIFAYARIMVSGDQEYNGKTLQPTITAEIQPSPHNRILNTAAFTGQTASEG